MDMPILDDLFFQVVGTAIANTSWRRADFAAVQEVEGRIAALRQFAMQHQNIAPRVAEEMPPSNNELPEVEQSTDTPVAPSLEANTEPSIDPDNLPAPEIKGEKGKLPDGIDEAVQTATAMAQAAEVRPNPADMVEEVPNDQ